MVIERLGDVSTHSPCVPFGWKAFLLIVGFGLIAYPAIDRERGPG